MSPSRKKKSPMVKARPRRSEEFKAEALKLAEQVGVAQAARDLGVYESQIYQWRSKALAQANRSERENKLLVENSKQKRELAKLREEVAILKKVSTYFAKQLL
jgi:transposase